MCENNKTILENVYIYVKSYRNDIPINCILHLELFLKRDLTYCMRLDASLNALLIILYFLFH